MGIHILDDPVRAIKEAYRVLRSGGKFYVGIVHPEAEKWDEKTGSCCVDSASSNKAEERVWVFNLTNGQKFIKHYSHRPLKFYEREFCKLFKINKKIEPKFKDKENSGKYATTEYLFLELIKK